jgi:hypothetical protein
MTTFGKLSQEDKREAIENAANTRERIKMMSKYIEESVADDPKEIEENLLLLHTGLLLDSTCTEEDKPKYAYLLSWSLLVGNDAATDFFAKTDVPLLVYFDGEGFNSFRLAVTRGKTNIVEAFVKSRQLMDGDIRFVLKCEEFEMFERILPHLRSETISFTHMVLDEMQRGDAFETNIKDPRWQRILDLVIEKESVIPPHPTLLWLLAKLDAADILESILTSKNRAPVFVINNAQQYPMYQILHFKAHKCLRLILEKYAASSFLLHRHSNLLHVACEKLDVGSIRIAKKFGVAVTTLVDKKLPLEAAMYHLHDRISKLLRNSKDMSDAFEELEKTFMEILDELLTPETVNGFSASISGIEHILGQEYGDTMAEQLVNKVVERFEHEGFRIETLLVPRRYSPGMLDRIKLILEKSRDRVDKMSEKVWANKCRESDMVCLETREGKRLFVDMAGVDEMETEGTYLRALLRARENGLQTETTTIEIPKITVDLSADSLREVAYYYETGEVREPTRGSGSYWSKRRKTEKDISEAAHLLALPSIINMEKD